MTQEVQVILTLDVHVDKSKEEIEFLLKFLLQDFLIKVDSIREEKEIYNNE